MRIISSLLLTILLAFTFISAQQKDAYYLVHEEKARIDQIPTYEKTALDWLKLAKEGQLDVPLHASMTDNFTYYYLMPLKNYAELDGINAKFNSAMEKAGKEKWAAMFAEANPSIENVKEFVVRWSASCSYTPEVSAAATEQVFTHFDFFHVKQGKMKDAVEVFKQWKQLYEDAKIPTGYDVWFAESGEDVNMVVFTESAKDAVTFYQRSAEYDKKVGPKAGELWDKFLTYLNDWSHVNGRERPDISYQVK